MRLIDVKTDNITDYGYGTAILLVFPYCSGKCGKECQNWQLRNSYKYFETTAYAIARLYNKLKTHNSIVMAGLEPFDSFDSVLDIILAVDKDCDFVIYTGYTEEEYTERFEHYLVNCFKTHARLHPNSKLIVKVGRYDSTQKESWYCKPLGVNLATRNQSAIVYTPDGGKNIYKYSKENKEDGNN